jgi:hypothetical protein
MTAVRRIEYPTEILGFLWRLEDLQETYLIVGMEDRICEMIESTHQTLAVLGHLDRDHLPRMAIHPMIEIGEIATLLLHLGMVTIHLTLRSDLPMKDSNETDTQFLLHRSVKIEEMIEKGMGLHQIEIIAILEVSEAVIVPEVIGVVEEDDNIKINVNAIGITMEFVILSLCGIVSHLHSCANVLFAR